MSQTFRVYARAVILNSEKQILMVKKQENQSIAAGKWILPGGAIEFGETPEEGLSRELKEEVNFSVQGLSLLGTDTILLDDTHWLGLLFAARGDIAAVFNKEPMKHAQIEWYDFVTARNHLSPNDTQSCELYFAHFP